LKILVVDDDLDLRGLTAYALRQGGYFVVEAGDGAAALAAFANESPDLVLLDVNLPGGMSGFDVLKKLREKSDVRVLMLTVRASEEDEVIGLDLGADDYLAKPYSPKTLLARVRALLRRTGTEGGTPALSVGPLVLDPERLTVTVEGGPRVTLTKLEFRLLQLLASNAGRPVATERVASHVWGDRGVVGDKPLVKQLVHRLRQKVEKDPAAPRFVLTASGVGYMLQV